MLQEKPVTPVRTLALKRATNPDMLQTSTPCNSAGGNTQYLCYLLYHGCSVHSLPCSGSQQGRLLSSLGKGAPWDGGVETHRAVSPTCQDPEVVDFAVQLQPAGNREVEEGRREVLKVLHCLTEPLALTKPHPCLPP